MPFLREGDNCWRISQVRKGAFLMEGESYFRAFRQAVLRAEHSVFILAWDLMEDVQLLRGDADDGYPSGLADFIYTVLQEKPKLHIHILVWDYSMVYIAERDWMPFTRWKKEPLPRLHVRTDSALSSGASHHQKVVVVDGSFAFCGGLDLSAWRWDTVEHLPNDPRRTDPKGKRYQPYHDVHMAVTGRIVDDLAELCAMRWERATGEALPTFGTTNADAIWPDFIEVDLESVEVGIALTFASYKTYAPSRHIERLRLDIIQSAERYIYIENQYFSSHTLVNALKQRLAEPGGPEIVIVLAKDTGGILEESTMGVLRERLLEILGEADTEDRFSVYSPWVVDEGGNESEMYVHAKLMICDDRIIEHGSANMSNRSMKVDSEVDLVFVDDENFPPARRLLRRLLGIHFGCSAEDVDVALRANASLRAAIQALGEGRRHQLRPLEYGCKNAIQRKLADTQLLDPDEPLDPGYLFKKALRPKEGGEDSKSGKAGGRDWKFYAKVGAWILGAALLAFAVKEAWGSVIDKETVISFFEDFRDSSMAVPILFAVFFVAGLVGVSINVLLVAATIVMGPWVAFGCCLVASLASAIVAFLIGSRFGKPLIRKFSTERIEKLSRKVGERGIWTVALIRVVPIAPFVVVNVVAGFSELKLRTFTIGSIVGMAPGMAGVVLVTHQVRSVLTNPSWQTWLGLGAAVVVFGAAAFYLKKRFK